MALDALKTPAPLKRPAEPEPTSPFAFAPEPARKKQKPSTKPTSSKAMSVLPDSGYNFQLCLHPRFDVFPEALRTAIENMHRAAYMAYMFSINSESHSSPKFTYSVVTGHRVSPCTEPNLTFTTHKADFKDLSMANMSLLMSFWTDNKNSLDGADYVRLDVKDIENPAMLWLYSVRPRDIGWSLDMDGCLSFSATRVVSGKLQQRVAFVECKVIEVKGDA